MSGQFEVESAFFHPGYDLVVLTGSIVRQPVRAGMVVDLPVALGGPGPVPVASLEYVEFTTGKRLALTVEYASLDGTTLEPGRLEGRVLELREP